MNWDTRSRLLCTILFDVFRVIITTNICVRESVPLSSIGASLHIIIPSAFVALPVSPVQALQPFARLRIISAGAFHNLVFWILLVVTAWLRIEHFAWTTMGYQDVGSFGRVVTAVEEVTPFSVDDGSIIDDPESRHHRFGSSYLPGLSSPP